MTGPLSHIRVLDLSRILAGPWATQLLADLGADVIKVERPQVGDDTRTWGPPFLTTPQGEDRRTSGYFLCANRAKRSLTLDFTKPKGQELIRALAKRSDILFENFKVGTLARYGLAYEDLQGHQSAIDLLLDHRLRSERAAPGRRSLRLHDPGDGRPDERHRRG